MKVPLRFLLLVAVAVWLALPGIGSDGGDNAGGTGVWILPKPTFLASGSPGISGLTQERGAHVVPSSIVPVAVTAADDLGIFTATLVDPVSGVATALPVNGRQIQLSAILLRSVRDGGVGASILVTDSQQLGYVMRISFSSTSGAGTIKVY